MSDDDSCLVEKLSHYTDLSEHDRQLLARLEEEECDYPSQTPVYETGDPANRLYVVKFGWLYSYKEMPDGRRQIIRIHHPGDIIGMPDIAFKHATLDVQTATPVRLCPFPKTHLDVVFETAPRLTALLFTIALREQVIFVEKLRAIGRMSARERLAYFLLDLVHRLRITNRAMTDTFRLPLTQTEIGDVTGLTNVSVSKTLMQLELDKLIRRRDGNISLLEEDELIAMCDFQDHYRDMDTSWFPGS